MLETIKAKIIFITISTLLSFGAISFFFEQVNYRHERKIIEDGADYEISTFEDMINSQISSLEDNAVDLALMGEIFYKSGRDPQVANYFTTQVFDYYKGTLGGGIWFEPYVISPESKWRCVYAFRKNGKIIIDRAFEGEAYDYLHQSWYEQIAPAVKNGAKVGWSRPYFDAAGSKVLMATAGAGIFHDNKLIGISTADWEIKDIVNMIKEMQPAQTKNSFALFGDPKSDFVIVSTDPYKSKKVEAGSSLKNIVWYNGAVPGRNRMTYKGEKYISFTKSLKNGLVLIVNVPEKELFSSIENTLNTIHIIMVISCLLISTMIFIALKRYINKPIDILIQNAEKIGNGNLDTKIEISNPKEFADLANTFNKMTKDIKTYIENIDSITRDKEKIASELLIARKIQESALPTDFNLKNNSIDIFAKMNPAKEVGGDFYDFFFVDPENFMFLVADVSGKGVPAALFMMISKTVIKNVAKEGVSNIKAMISRINNKIYKNNKEGFFITLFAGILNIKTGKLSCINCGHNPPLLQRVDGKYEYLKMKSNLVLGVLSDISFDIQEMTLNEGDKLFLYTDGVTEAMDVKLSLYGEERLMKALNRNLNLGVEETVSRVRKDIANFVEAHEQSDDITMMSLQFKNLESKDGKYKKEFICPSDKDKYAEFLGWLETTCEELSLDMPLVNKLELVCEEIFLNIANYAYGSKEGKINVSFFNDEDEISIQFVDSGMEYNPLKREDPDITLSADKREIGGLGIFLIKKMSDNVKYERKDGQNILTIVLGKKNS